jgi:stearoyl-CoA desaturase (delta-9 desaturase)
MAPVISAVLIGLAVSQFATLVTSVYLHRTLSHRAMTLTPGVTLAFRVLTWTTTGIRPRQWVAVHRRHHAFTDVEGDPHSPLLEGFLAVQLGNVVLYRRAARDPLTLTRYARDLPPDRLDRVLFDHAFVGLALGVGLLCAVLGWRLGLLAGGVHGAGYLLLSAAVNAVGHRFGRQPRPITSRNSQLLAWVTAGEGLHNNHHAAPTSARFALAAGETDPGWWLVRLLQRAGRAQIRHTDPRVKLPRRAAA